METVVTTATLGKPGRRGWLRSALLQDAALALAVTIAEVFFWGSPVMPGASWQNRVLPFAFAVPEAVALTLRRRWPVKAFATVWVVAVAAHLLSLNTDFDFLPYFGLLIALYTVARQSDWPAALAALALAFVPAGMGVWYTAAKVAVPGHATSLAIGDIAFYLPLTLAAWGIGRWTRSTAAAAERDQRELAAARQAVATERAQIARELHDIVANAVAVIVMQAETVRSTAPADPARLTETLVAIEDLGRSAMAELRRMLRLLRTADAPVAEASGRRGVADVESLLEDARRAGIEIGLQVYGTPTRLDDSVDLTAYRLVQEAVTNIIKHAGPGSHASVRITWSEVLRLDVVDDGAGRSPRVGGELSTGHGLLGLAERIALFGGELAASPYRSGFRVTATLPLAPVVDAA